MENSKQIFQTDGKKRWKNLQSGTRIFIFVGALLFLALGLMMKFDIIMVDDGSGDSTYEKAKAEFTDHPKLKIFSKINGGEKQQFLKQRFRWTYGIMQMFWKQRHTFLNPKYKGLGLWAMPNILLFQYIIPFFSPLADVIMFLGILSGNGDKIFSYYLIFILVDASLALMAFIIQREKLVNLLYIIPQRFGLSMVDVYRTVPKLEKSSERRNTDLGILKTTGNVKEVAAS